MGKAPATAADSEGGRLRSIPSVERILSSAAFAPLVGEFGRDRTKYAVSRHLGELRETRRTFDESAAVAAVSQQLTSSLRRVINATGIIIHTNLGRSPIDDEIWGEAAQLVTGYSNLE